jgi:AraC-like DNA-binding protein
MWKSVDLRIHVYRCKLLKVAWSILEENIINTDFDVDTFSREIGMSRTNLHRKLKALTDCSATEFIRIVRLQRAMYLLEHKFGNITDVAYAVGFNSQSYFTKCFKKEIEPVLTETGMTKTSHREMIIEAKFHLTLKNQIINR